MRIVEGLIQGSDAWKEFRECGIGSSEIAAIMGLSSHKKAIDIYNEKMGLTTPYVNSAMQRGSSYEAEARKAFEGDSNMPFHPICCIHDEYDYFRASLDGYNEEANSVLEIKVPKEQNYEAMCKSIPEMYNIQMQWQMMVSGAKTAVFLVYNPETKEFKSKVVYPDVSLREEMTEAAKTFWENFQQGIPPEAPEDLSICVEDDELEGRSEKWLMFDEMEKVATKGKKEEREAMLDFGDDGDFHGRLLRFKKVYTEGRIDYEAMLTDLGVASDVIEKYRKPGSWTYRISRNKEL